MSNILNDIKFFWKEKYFSYLEIKIIKIVYIVAYYPIIVIKSFILSYIYNLYQV